MGTSGSAILSILFILSSSLQAVRARMGDQKKVYFS